MDYRKFLGKKETVVLPYFGGRRLDAKDRTLRLGEATTPGVYSFEIEGRNARTIAPADPLDLGALPKVRGHRVGDYVFVIGAGAELLFLVSEEEIDPMTPCIARRWYSGELILESMDFDGDAELGARAALEEDRGVVDVKGVGASLRAAFAFALASKHARAIGQACSPREIAPFTLDIAERGVPAAVFALEELTRRRNAGFVRIGDRLVNVGRQVRELRAQERAPTLENASERAADAIDAAGGRMLAARLVDRTMLEVRFQFMNERFVSVAEPITLNVIDAGICLVDYEENRRGDSEITLDSLPSVIKEAIDLDALVITRRE